MTLSSNGRILSSLIFLRENNMASWRKLFFYWIFQSSWGKIGKEFSLTFPKVKKQIYIYILYIYSSKRIIQPFSLSYKKIKTNREANEICMENKGSTFFFPLSIFFPFSVGSMDKSRQEMDSYGFHLETNKVVLPGHPRNDGCRRTNKQAEFDQFHFIGGAYTRGIHDLPSGQMALFSWWSITSGLLALWIPT